MGNTLDNIVKDLGDTYYIRKEADDLIQGSKKPDEYIGLRQEFFDAATSSIQEDELATKTILLDEWTDELKNRVVKYHPGWEIISAREADDGFKVIVRENADLKQVTVEYDGYKITKQIRSGTVMIDDDRMKNEDPDLYESITTWPDWLYFILDNVSEEKFEGWASEYRWKKIFIDPADWSDETREAVADYTYEGPKTKALIVEKVNG